jgi:phosphoadenosine phosphosulfate reductase
MFPEKLDRARRFLASIEKNHSPSALASSFGAEDMVLLDLIARDGLAIGVFTIDTGRLPRETHALIAEVRRHYGIDVEVFTPWPDSVEAYVAEHGVDGFYDGVEQRAACCHVRKVEPLRRALASRRGWITGLRREQSDSRLNVTEAEHDPVHRKWKFSPLTAWTSEEVWTYLHARGYPSIGCEPCTRAVKPGEHPRAGRWWWEQEAAAKECGLHAIPIRVAEPA